MFGTIFAVNNLVKQQVEEILSPDKINAKPLINTQALEEIEFLIKQFWYGSTFTNELLLGDPVLSFKLDFKDFLNLCFKT